MEPQPARRWEYLAVPFKDGGDLKKNSEDLSRGGAPAAGALLHCPSGMQRAR